MKTLIVDDDFLHRQLLYKQLQKYGECQLSSNGVQALKHFDEALEEGEPFDLICLDIMMPGIDGQETLAEIRKMEDNHQRFDVDRVKIIMTTSLADRENVVTAIKNKCDGYLVKPISQDNLKAELTKLKLI